MKKAFNIAWIGDFLQDFKRFVRNPEQALEGSTDRPFQLFAAALAADILFVASFTLPVIYLIDRYVLKLRFSPGYTEPTTLVVMILSVAVLAPILEEILFRYPLKFARGRSLKILIHVSSLAFGFVHLINYANREILFFLLSPLIFSSQLIGGFIFAYLRLKLGLRWSILSHATFNGLALGLAILFTHGNVTLDESTEHYTLYVKEYMYVGTEPARLDIRRTNGGIDTLLVRQASLQAVIDSLMGHGTYVDDAIVDIDFNADTPMATDSLMNLFRKEYRIE